MGKSNLRFAGMNIAVNISVDGLGLLVPTTRQVKLSTPTTSKTKLDSSPYLVWVPFKICGSVKIFKIQLHRALSHLDSKNTHPETYI